jgi:hypothetical protein
MDIFPIITLILMIALCAWLVFDLVRSIQKYIERKKFNQEVNKDGCENESKENEHSEQTRS